MLFNSPIQTIDHPVLSEQEIALWVKRDDLIHPFVSGNKGRKLKYLLADAIQQQKTTLVTFGGAYSNHLLATAFAAKEHGLQAIGYVRGEEIQASSNAVLKHCLDLGMEIRPIDRNSYRNKQSIFEENFRDDARAYFIDEGGCSELAAKGVSELIGELPEVYSHVCCACGTGTTLAGIAMGLQKAKLPTQALGIAVLKGADFLRDDIRKLAPNCSNWQLFTEYHCGGYAQSNTDLLAWMKDFSRYSDLPLEPVYTGKAFYALFQLIKNGSFLKNSRILMIHTGGIIPA